MPPLVAVALEESGGSFITTGIIITVRTKFFHSPFLEPVHFNSQTPSKSKNPCYMFLHFRLCINHTSRVFPTKFYNKHFIRISHFFPSLLYVSPKSIFWFIRLHNMGRNVGLQIKKLMVMGNVLFSDVFSLYSTYNNGYSYVRRVMYTRRQLFETVSYNKLYPRNCLLMNIYRMAAKSEPLVLIAWTLRTWVRIPLKSWIFFLVYSSSFTCHPIINAV
jgi:hypothetical protein